MNWTRVNKEFPCLICGKSDWCTFVLNAVVCCMRVKSQKPLKNGGFWHSWPADTGPVSIPVMHQQNASFNPEIYWRWVADNNPPMEARHAIKQLGCDWSAFARLGMVWASEYHAWAFPMKNATKMIIGIQLRRLDGKKLAVKGSHNGLFIPDQPMSSTVLLCEGASDTAAALTLGFYAIGRQSCSSRMDLVIDFCRANGIREVIIVSDSDEPGLNGAVDLAKVLKIDLCMVVPPTKDLREFVQMGGDRETLDNLIHQTVKQVRR